MKWFIFLYVFLMFPTFGCTKYVGSPHSTVTVFIKNDSSQPIHVGWQRHLKWRPGGVFDQINPGAQYKKTFGAVELVEYTIIAFLEGAENKLGHSKQAVIFEKTGLYTDKPIVITNLTLLGKNKQWGFVMNSTGVPGKIWDIQGNQYGVLQPGEVGWGDIISGKDLILFFQPLLNYGHYQKTSRYVMKVDLIKDTPYGGKLEWWGYSIDTLNH